ncbi:MAG: alpha/beta hydrolase [Bryobacteraceae bacterium]|nr:alpha/beta hydrolase [Bryobacteraceae bacterium]
MRKFTPLLLLLCACAAAQDKRPAALPEWVEVDSNVPYSEYKQTVVDILRPKAPHRGKRPGVIVIHGGGWVRLSKDQLVESFCIPYLKAGFVVANVEYRLADVAPAPAAVEDVLRAAHWFRKNAGKYNVDRKRIVVTGASAGGHLALMVGMVSRKARLGPRTKVAAVVNFFGITDVGDQIEGPNMREYAVKWVPEQPDRRMLAWRVSPIAYIRKGLPPILTIHGDADQTVPYEHGFNLTRQLRQVGVDAEMISIANGRHGLTHEKLVELHHDRVFEFLRRHRILQE